MKHLTFGIIAVVAIVVMIFGVVPLLNEQLGSEYNKQTVCEGTLKDVKIQDGSLISNGRTTLYFSNGEVCSLDKVVDNLKIGAQYRVWKYRGMSVPLLDEVSPAAKSCVDEWPSYVRLSTPSDINLTMHTYWNETGRGVVYYYFDSTRPLTWDVMNPTCKDIMVTGIKFTYPLDYWSMKSYEGEAFAYPEPFEILITQNGIVHVVATLRNGTADLRQPLLIPAKTTYAVNYGYISGGYFTGNQTTYSSIVITVTVDGKTLSDHVAVGNLRRIE